MPEIKNTDFNPCPICGKDVEVRQSNDGFFWLECSKCLVRYDYKIYRYDKILVLLNWWNKLTPKRESVAWKKDFNIYKADAEKAFYELLNDQEFQLKLRDRLESNINIRESFVKSYKVYWGTEDGWKNKKRKSAKTINWKATYLKTISMNKVFYPFGYQANNMDSPANDQVVM